MINHFTLGKALLCSSGTEHGTGTRGKGSSSAMRCDPEAMLANPVVKTQQQRREPVSLKTHVGILCFQCRLPLKTRLYENS